MPLSRLGNWSFTGLWMFVAALSPSNLTGATIVPAPGEAGLRAAIEAAQPGDTVMLTSYVQLTATLVVNKRLTLTVDPVEAWRIWMEGQFEGALLDFSTNEIVLDGVKLFGSARTDALRADVTTLTLRDCTIAGCRRPVMSSSGGVTLRLERVTVSDNHEGIGCQSLEAKDCTFSGNRGWTGLGAHTVKLDACVVEYNRGNGLNLNNGNLKNCVFRFNTDFGLWFDPDNGYMSLKSCLFYANAGGGAYLGEGGYATLDNCTFTRHTGRPAIYVTTDAHDMFFRHCTVTDNVAIESEDWLSRSATFWIGSSAKLENCLIADNPTAEDPNASSLAGTWIDKGGNVIGGPAHLSTLRDNGGPTLSLMPLTGSPAIDAGKATDVVRDARGLSRIAGPAPDAGAIETGAGDLADTDADGLPDIWESLHGLNSKDPADALSDSDGDGQNARAEFGSGTDPADRESVHQIEEVVLSLMSREQPYPLWGQLTWTRYPGVFYDVEASNDLRNWRRLPDTGSPGGSALWWSLGLIEADSPSTFYRVLAVK